jgi:hypothetical protein
MANETAQLPVENQGVSEQQGENQNQPKWSKEVLMKVFDELMFEGEYREDVTIRGKLKVRFRTRTAEETVQISKLLDQSQFNLILTVQEHRAIYNLRASLESYNGQDLSSMALEEKLKFINKLNIQIVSALSDALAEFDGKVEAACREANENF